MPILFEFSISLAPPSDHKEEGFCWLWQHGTKKRASAGCDNMVQRRGLLASTGCGNMAHNYKRACFCRSLQAVAIWYIMLSLANVTVGQVS